MSNPHSSLSYLPCDHFAGRVDTAPCMNEGLYFCTLCGVRYCDDHLCMHLLAQFEHDNDGVCYESTQHIREENLQLHYAADNSNAVDIDSERSAIVDGIRIFRESTEETLRGVAEMELRSYLARLMSEAKRVQRELERRMIEGFEKEGIRRHVPVLSHDQRELLIGRMHAGELSAKEAAKQAKQQEREAKRKAKMQAAIDILNAAIQSGKLSKESALNLIKKAGA